MGDVRRWRRHRADGGPGPVPGLFVLAAGVAVALASAGCASSPPAAAAVPTLGRPAGVFARGEGFGQVRPSKIFNGGDPTGLVSHITWKSWGGPGRPGPG